MFKGSKCLLQYCVSYIPVLLRGLGIGANYFFHHFISPHIFSNCRNCRNVLNSINKKTICKRLLHILTAGCTFQLNQKLYKETERYSLQGPFSYLSWKKCELLT